MMQIMTILRDCLTYFFRKKKQVCNPCKLTYIPNRLHTNDRPPIESFGVGELLFRRCRPDEINNPYNCTLAELSHNRKGLDDNQLSQESDVLYNIRPDVNIQIFNDMVVCPIKIKDLNSIGLYDKLFNDENGNIARILLIHEPETCMYPHCVFRIWYNDELATFENRPYTKNRKIRIKLKDEFVSMIVTQTLSQTA